MFLNLLQAYNEGQSQFLSNLTTSEAFLMVIVVGVAGTESDFFSSEPLQAVSMKGVIDAQSETAINPCKKP